MKNISGLLIGVCVLFSSCRHNLPGFDFRSFDRTPAKELAKAVSTEDLKEIERLVKSNNVPVDYLDPAFGHSLLMLSVANDLEKSTVKLLELGANPNLKSKIDSEDDSSYVDTPMLIACDDILTQKACNTTLLNSLIKHGGNVNDRIQVRFVGADYLSYETPLLKVSGGRCLDVLKLLVESGADINSYNYKEGVGPITEAIVQDRMENLRYLVIDRKARIPEYCFVVQAYNETKRKTYTVTAFLQKKNYKQGSKEDNIRSEVLEYLKKNRLE